MSEPVSPFELKPPSARRLALGFGAAIFAATAILLVIVLPAEFGIDPTRLGRAMGLTAIPAPTRSLTVVDVVGGNERYREVKLPDPGEPIPLPNPAIVQIKSTEARTRTQTVRLEPNQETEIKAVLDQAQVILYSWATDGNEVYTDFHGHEPAAGQSFVRYEEQQSGKGGNGSLVAPFSGEHGWFWLNISDQPVTITLKVSGYFSDIKDYGILR